MNRGKRALQKTLIQLGLVALVLLLIYLGFLWYTDRQLNVQLETMYSHGVPRNLMAPYEGLPRSTIDIAKI